MGMLTIGPAPEHDSMMPSGNVPKNEDAPSAARSIVSPGAPVAVTSGRSPMARGRWTDVYDLGGGRNLKRYRDPSAEPNATFDEWTIKIREGVTFHDGSDLDATVVKNNLDAVRGQYPGRTALLGSAVFSNIESVEVVDPMTVRVTTVDPWVAFRAHDSGEIGE